MTLGQCSFFTGSLDYGKRTIFCRSLEVHVCNTQLRSSSEEPALTDSEGDSSDSSIDVTPKTERAANRYPDTKNTAQGT